MIRTTVQVSGMRCGMCEAHVCDVIRKAVPSAKKVKATRTRNEATFLSEDETDEKVLVKAIADMGYVAYGFTSEPYKRRFLFGK